MTARPGPNSGGPSPAGRLLSKFLVVALCITCSAILGVTAGILAFAAGTELPDTFLNGGGAFLVALPVALAVAEALGGGNADLSVTLDRVLIVALCASVATIVGLVAGLLAFASGIELAASFLRGGGAFALTLLLELGIVATLHRR
jgi:hypothetical protein